MHQTASAKCLDRNTTLVLLPSIQYLRLSSSELSGYTFLALDQTRLDLVNNLQLVLGSPLGSNLNDILVLVDGPILLHPLYNVIC